MLANILPGVRELRAPLVAGYLWLAVAWVVLGGSTAHLTSRLGRDAAALAHEGGRPAALATVSIGAYLLGLLSVTVSSAVVRFVESIGVVQRQASYLRLLNTIAASRVNASYNDLTYRRRPVWYMLGYIAFFPVVRVAESANSYSNRNRKLRELEDSKKIASSHFYRVLERAPNPLSANELLTDPYAQALSAAQARTAIANEIATRLRVDLPFMRTRLIGIQQELYSSIDRLNAESEFRSSVSIPLAVLIAVAGDTYDTNILWLMVLPLALFLLAIAKLQESLTAIAQALYAGRVPTPVLDLPDSTGLGHQTSDASLVPEPTTEAATSADLGEAGSDVDTGATL